MFLHTGTLYTIGLRETMCQSESESDDGDDDDDYELYDDGPAKTDESHQNIDKLADSGRVTVALIWPERE